MPSHFKTQIKNLFYSIGQIITTPPHGCSRYDTNYDIIFADIKFFQLCYN